MFANTYEYKAALQEVKILSELKPAGNSPLGTRISLILQAINQYEQHLFEQFKRHLRGEIISNYFLYPSGNFTVEGFLNNKDVQLTQDGNSYIMDLYVNGEFNEHLNVGDSVNISWSHPYLYIAHGVKRITAEG